ncbi:MAG TPA: hypothetical protein VG274_00585 [Rhizomicrobium sp.]|nr:hypothetical protein [Rhizomicrobium sp.]
MAAHPRLLMILYGATPYCGAADGVTLSVTKIQLLVGARPRHFWAEAHTALY